MNPSLIFKYLFFLLVNFTLFSCSSKKSENENKVSKEVEDDFRAMNPVEVGDEKRLYYDVPIPALPKFDPIPYLGARNTEEEFTRERERLFVI
jgi:hypothetical protein